MENEIKEILNYMKQYVENKYEHDSEPMLNWKDIKCVLDYITNLQTIEKQYSAILSENAELENKITNLQEENKRLKNLEYKFFDNSGDEESFTLEDYLELGNKLYDLKEENERLKEEIEILTSDDDNDSVWLEKDNM